GIPIDKWNVFRRNFDEARAGFREPPREQATQAELARVILVVAGFRFERKVEGPGCRRTEQAMRVVHRAEQRLFLIIAAELADWILRNQFFVIALAPLEAGRSHSRRRAHCL